MRRARDAARALNAAHHRHAADESGRDLWNLQTLFGDALQPQDHSAVFSGFSSLLIILHKRTLNRAEVLSSLRHVRCAHFDICLLL